MIKKGTHVWVGPLYAYGGNILVTNENGNHGIIKGWSDYFKGYLVLIDGWKDYMVVKPENITVLEDDKEN